MSVMKKAGVIILYSIGVLITLILLCLFLSRSDYVPYPDSMLPAPLEDLASEWLALGALPMSIASLLFDKTIFRQKSAQHKRNYLLLYLPAIICTCFFLYWTVVLAMGILITSLHF